MESDPLMNGGEVQPRAMRKPGKHHGHNYWPVVMLPLVMLPWLMFTLVSCLFAFVSEAFPMMVWALTICCISLSCLLMSIFRISGHKGHLVLGGACAIACFNGIVLGMYCEEAYISENFRVEDGAKYHNVEPSEPATSHSDAATLTFSVGTAIDTTRAVGYKTSEDTYCVAPILDGSGSDSGKVEYWAVGVNCCQSRGDFECDDSLIIGTRSCIVISQDDSDSEHYGSAIHVAEAAHSLTSASGALLVRWVADPQAFQSQLWSSGVQLITAASMLYLIVSIAAAFMAGSIVKLDRREDSTVRL